MQREKKRLRQANDNAYINLQLSCEELPYDLVSLAKTEELPDGCTRDAWERLTSEYDLTEGKDKIAFLSMFQQNQLEDVITEVWHMAHFWVSYGRCTMPGSPMGRSEGSSRRWTG